MHVSDDWAFCIFSSPLYSFSLDKKFSIHSVKKKIQSSVTNIYCLCDVLDDIFIY